MARPQCRHRHRGPVTGAPASGNWLAGGDPDAGPRGWALPAEEYAGPFGEGETEQLRAAQLARLGPRAGDLVWDIGCGSGAFTTEAGRFGAAVIAVDRDADACARTLAVARRFGIQVQIVHGTAPHALEDLPEPDVVRVGGGERPSSRPSRTGAPPASSRTPRHATTPNSSAGT